MNAEVVSKLHQEFSREQIKNRRGPSGKQLDYIEAHAVIARLNAALDADWSFEIIEHKILDNEVVVVGKLTVHTEPVVIKTAFGSQQIKRYEQSGEIICLGDDLKAAASDALKKAATLLGVGLHLYDRDSRNFNGNAPVANNIRRFPVQPVHGAGNGNGRNGNGGNGKAQQASGNGSNGNNGGNGHEVLIREPNAPLTVAQMKAIFRIGKSNGMNNQSIQALVKERFGKDVVDALTKQEASDLISSLQQSE